MVWEGQTPYTFTYNINGGSNQTVTTTSGNTVTVSVPTNIPGTYTYNLVNVQEAGVEYMCRFSKRKCNSGCKIITGLQLSQAMCNDLPGCKHPTITFTGSNGAQRLIYSPTM
jgi:hypothetical protein